MSSVGKLRDFLEEIMFMLRYKDGGRLMSVFISLRQGLIIYYDAEAGLELLIPIAGIIVIYYHT